MTTDLIARLRRVADENAAFSFDDLYAAADALEAKELENAELKSVAAEMARQLRGILVDYDGYETGRQINMALDRYRALIGEKP